MIAVAFASAPPAGAAPVVPQLSDDAVLGEPCSNTTRFVFGTDATGTMFTCASSQKPGQWVQIPNLVGVREIGSKGCVADVLAVTPDGNGWTAAQSPDGVPLGCIYPTDTWEVH